MSCFSHHHRHLPGLVVKGVEKWGRIQQKIHSTWTRHDMKCDNSASKDWAMSPKKMQSWTNLFNLVRRCNIICFWLARVSEWVNEGLTFHSTHYSGFRWQFVQARWPSQHCHSIKESQLTCIVWTCLLLILCCSLQNGNTQITRSFRRFGRRKRMRRSIRTSARFVFHIIFHIFTLKRNILLNTFYASGDGRCI